MNPYGSFGTHTYWRLQLDQATYITTLHFFANTFGGGSAIHEYIGYTLTAAASVASTLVKTLPG